MSISIKNPKFGCYLHGSRSRGRERPNSDLDLLVICELKDFENVKTLIRKHLFQKQPEWKLLSIDWSHVPLGSSIPSSAVAVLILAELRQNKVKPIVGEDLLSDCIAIDHQLLLSAQKSVLIFWKKQFLNGSAQDWLRQILHFGSLRPAYACILSFYSYFHLVKESKMEFVLPEKISDQRFLDFHHFAMQFQNLHLSGTNRGIIAQLENFLVGFHLHFNLVISDFSKNSNQISKKTKIKSSFGIYPFGSQQRGKQSTESDFDFIYFGPAEIEKDVISDFKKQFYKTYSHLKNPVLDIKSSPLSPDLPLQALVPFAVEEIRQFKTEPVYGSHVIDQIFLVTPKIKEAAELSILSGFKKNILSAPDQILIEKLKHIQSLRPIYSMAVSFEMAKLFYQNPTKKNTAPFTQPIFPEMIHDHRFNEIKRIIRTDFHFDPRLLDNSDFRNWLFIQVHYYRLIWNTNFSDLTLYYNDTFRFDKAG